MTDLLPPRFEDAPGLVLKRRKDGWACIWQCRSDLAARGFTPKSFTICLVGDEPNDEERAWVSDRCNAIQTEMIVWGRGGVPVAQVYDGTLGSLIACYQTDPASRFHKIRHATRQNYTFQLRRMVREHGEAELAALRAKDIIAWHEEWLKIGVPTAHAFIGILRMVFTFGKVFLEDEDRALGGHCLRLSSLLHDMKFKMAQPRKERMTADQAEAICDRAFETGLRSLALAQAFQFECILRQKDVIGEWVPMSEPGMSDVLRGNTKWLRGLRWSEIDESWRLKHVTSKRQKEIEVDLKLAPLVMKELERQGFLADKPADGPVIVSEYDGVPYYPWEFRKRWRKVADAVGVPRAVYNMDSRAGAISEATDAGAELEHVRHAATHGDIAMTQKYSRGTAEKIANVQRLRAEHRNKK